MQHSLPRFAPLHRLEALNHASLALLIGWASLLLIGIGLVLVIPASLCFVVGLRRLKGMGWGFEAVLSALMIVAMAAAVAAGVFYWDWWSSYSYWYGYTNINSGYVVAIAMLVIIALICSALINIAAARLATICRWRPVARFAWLAASITILLGLIPVVGILSELIPFGGVFELWWEAWDNALGSPMWYAVGVISLVQFVCWVRLRRGLRRLIAQRMSQA